MKRILFLSLLLSGCYLANGSPSSYHYWLKNDKVITYNDMKFCEKKVYLTLGERFKYLSKMMEINGWISMRENYRKEYNEYIAYITKASPYISYCYYELGYRFRPPIYWCLAQDGDNTRICTENMKYRN